MRNEVRYAALQQDMAEVGGECKFMCHVVIVYAVYRIASNPPQELDGLLYKSHKQRFGQF